MKKFRNTEKGKPGEWLGILAAVPVPIKIEEEIEDDDRQWTFQCPAQLDSGQ